MTHIGKWSSFNAKQIAVFARLKRFLLKQQIARKIAWFSI